MKKFKLYLLCLMFLGLILANRGIANGNWNLVLTTEIQTADFSAGAPGVGLVGFLDEVYGLAIGPHGEIRYTESGGKEWQRANCPNFPAELNGLEILDVNTAWSSGGSFNRVTRDGGRNWSALPDYGSLYTPGRYLSFINGKTGWFGATNQVAATNDGGVNWTPVNLPKDTQGDIMAVHLLSENIGYILSNHGVLYRTQDGGQTWEPMRLPLKGRKPVSVIPYASIETVRFQDIMHGIMVLYAEKPRGFYILKTEDGGKHWREESLPPDSGVTLGNVFLSRDGKYLTINDIHHNRILLFKHNT
jgi:photosystem II stability/assembly factor-like uncharacterized protein